MIINKRNSRIEIISGFLLILSIYACSSNSFRYDTNKKAIVSGFNLDRVVTEIKDQKKDSIISICRWVPRDNTKLKKEVVLVEWDYYFKPANCQIKLGNIFKAPSQRIIVSIKNLSNGDAASTLINLTVDEAGNIEPLTPVQ